MAIDIDLWLWSLDRNPAETLALGMFLDAQETQRANRFVKARDRDRFIVGRGRLRQILAGYVECTPDMIALPVIERGKPTLVDGPAFNLSHSGGWAALAIAPAHTEQSLKLGIDIEAFRPFKPHLVQQVFSTAEQAEFAVVPDTQRARTFFCGWTRKEALIKALGTGLYTALDSFDVSLTPDSSAQVLHCGADMPPPSEWVLHHLDLAPQMVGAIAATSHGKPLRVTLRSGSLPLG